MWAVTFLALFSSLAVHLIVVFVSKSGFSDELGCAKELGKGLSVS